MERITRIETNTLARLGLTVGLLWLLLAPGTALAWTFNFTAAPTTRTTNSTFATNTATAPVVDVVVEEVHEDADGSTTAPSVLEDAVEIGPGTSVAADLRLQVNGGTPEEPLVVDATPKSFASWDALFAHLEDALGATLIHDDAGEVVGARGQYVQRGSVVFDDEGTEFESMDYVAATLGGLEGALQVGNQMVALANAPSTELSFLEQTEQSCDASGEDCVQGHSWLTHFWLYHSFGARTKQISGGTEPIPVRYCSSGTLVKLSGVWQCKVRNSTVWEFDPEIREWMPVPFAEGEEYFYRPVDIRYEQHLRNQLNVTARVLFGALSPLGDQINRTELNTRKVEVGSWTIMRDVLDDDFGNTVPLENVTGVCGFHSSNKGGFVETADGSTGDDDVLCTGSAGF